MAVIKALIVDDSPTVRAMLADILERLGGMQVVGEASDGQQAIREVEALKPDVITMDIHMPAMNGLAATREIMRRWPTPIVIVSGSDSAADVRNAMSALEEGALAILQKPPGPGRPDFESATRHLAETVRAMADVRVVRRSGAGPPEGATQRKKPGRASALPAPERARIVGIVGSTGGPQALSQILTTLPNAFSAPILVVQHMADGFIEGFAEWLAGYSDLPVRMARDGSPVLPGEVIIAPSNRHLGIGQKNTAALSSADPIGGFRPSGTYLLRSIAQGYGASAIAVVLTGMGRDGADGAGEVRRRGGSVIVQNETSSTVYGMPQAAIDACGSLEALPPVQIARRLVELTHQPKQNG